MVHSFKACGVYVALDVDSGSVFQIDPLAHEVIQLYEGHTYQEVFDLLSPQWGRQAVKRAYGEIDELVRQGLLFKMCIRDRPAPAAHICLRCCSNSGAHPPANPGQNPSRR